MKSILTLRLYGIIGAAAIIGLSAGLAGCSGGNGGLLPLGGEGKIVFASNRDGNANEIYLMNPDGSGLTRLTNNPAYDADPALSPRRDKVVFMSHRDGPSGDVYVLDIATQNVQRLAPWRFNDDYPTFSPRADEIAFVSDREGDFEIYSMRSDGTNVRRLTQSDELYVAEPSFSPDGKRIVFVGTSIADGGGCNIYIVSATGGPITRLTEDYKDSDATFSPDGRHIAFASFRDGNSEIYLMNVDGSGIQRLTNHPGSDGQPTFSPDGKRIAFTSTRDGKTAIFVMNVDGSQVTRLTDNAFFSHSPHWR